MWSDAALLSPAPAEAASNSSRVLLVIHLAGGNDALNTVVPYRSTSYYRARPTIHIARDKVCRLNEEYGLHPALAPLLPMFRKGSLAVVNGVSYEDASKSHVLATDAWQTVLSRLEEPSSESTGQNEPPTRALTLFDGNCSHETFKGALTQFEEVLISDSIKQPVFKITLDGFDTHRDQLVRHESLLDVVGTGLVSLFQSLESNHLDERVLVLAHSEFGRGLRENDEGGTDHGDAGTCFLIGRNVRGGIYGAHSFSSSSENDLQKVVDLGRISADLQNGWFNRNVYSARSLRRKPHSFLS